MSVIPNEQNYGLQKEKNGSWNFSLEKSLEMLHSYYLHSQILIVTPGQNSQHTQIVALHWSFIILMITSNRFTWIQVSLSFRFYLVVCCFIIFHYLDLTSTNIYFKLCFAFLLVLFCFWEWGPMEGVVWNNGKTSWYHNFSKIIITIIVRGNKAAFALLL